VLVVVKLTNRKCDKLQSYKCACACQADKQKCDTLQTDEEQREREACEASMQHLPSGIQPQTAQQPAGVCHVCYVEDYSDDNLLLEVIVVTTTRIIVITTIMITMIMLTIITITTTTIINNSNNNNNNNSNKRFPAHDELGTTGEPHQLSMQWQSGLGCAQDNRQSLNTTCYHTAATRFLQACAGLDVRISAVLPIPAPSAAANHKVHVPLLVCQSVQQCSCRHIKHGCLACMADVKISLLRQ